MNPSGAFFEWGRFSKINFMLIVTALVLTTRARIEGALLVVVLSLAFYGMKGGLFTLRGGGEGTVWGPDNSFIAGNNELAFALVVVLPMAWYFYLQYSRAYKWIQWGAPVAAGLCLLSILGSQSRGAFLAVAAMLAFLWLRTRQKVVTGLLVAVAGVAALMFMPQDWTDRMESIRTYQEDGSAQGRINAWKFAINLANDHPVVRRRGQCLHGERYSSNMRRSRTTYMTLTVSTSKFWRNRATLDWRSTCCWECSRLEQVRGSSGWRSHTRS